MNAVASIAPVTKAQINLIVTQPYGGARVVARAYSAEALQEEQRYWETQPRSSRFPSSWESTAVIHSGSAKAGFDRHIARDVDFAFDNMQVK